MATGILSRITGGVLGNALGYGVGTAMGPALAPISQELANEAWPDLPIVPIPVADAASMAVQGVLSEDDAAQEALMQGVNRDRFHKLFLVNGDPIAPEQALDLWNRGEIKETDVDRALLQSRLKPEWVDTFKLLRRQLLQAAELAEMVVQDILPQSEAETHAARLGFHAEDFGRMVRLAGNPPGPQDILSLWNRGFMDEAQATLALRQSRLKPEWIETFKRSRIRPASVPQAVESVVRERIPHAEGARIAAENGIDAATFDLMVNVAGRPIGTVQALTLYNRGKFTKAQVREVVARSDVRTEYTPAILDLAVRYPSIQQVRLLVQTGAVSDEYATRLLTEQGYPHDLAAGVVAAGHNAKNHPDRELTKTEITTLYETQALSSADATAMLRELGYDEREAGFLLSMADFRREAKYIEAVITRLHAQYVAHRIELDVVTTTLDRLQVPVGQREQLLDLWAEERAANVKVLTPAQVVRAVKKTVIGPDEGIAILQADGYSARHAAILLRNADVNVPLPT